MRLIRAADYAVRVLVHLARQDGRARVTRESLIENTGVPAAFLKRIIQTLVQSKLVAAQRGAGGGCSLALPAKEISVLRVIESIDGPVEVSECVSRQGVCPRSGSCAFRRLLIQLQQQTTTLLGGTTVADLASDHAPHLCVPETIRRCE